MAGMSDTLVSARTALHPTPEQAQMLEDLWSAANLLHLTLRRWLRYRGRGRTMHIREALWQVAEGHELPVVRDSETISIRFDALGELGALKMHELPPFWQRLLPTGTVQAIIDIEMRRLQRFDSHERAGHALRLTPLSRLPLDRSVEVYTAWQVLIRDQVMVADLWALPDDIRAAIRYSRVDRSLPHRADHISLLRSSSMFSSWYLVWTVRIPQHYLQVASIDDTLGIDLGYRRLVTMADRSQFWTVDRQGDAHLHLQLSAVPETAEALLADARHRELLLDYHRSDLETAVKSALKYKEVHIEHQDYSSLARRGAAPWSARAMRDLGAAYVPEWIEMLADATHTRVVHVDPGAGTRICAICGAKGRRPAPYTHVICPSCGPIDADVNAARLARFADTGHSAR